MFLRFIFRLALRVHVLTGILGSYIFGSSFFKGGGRGGDFNGCHSWLVPSMDMQFVRD